jgi:hypothetical protein
MPTVFADPIEEGRAADGGNLTQLPPPEGTSSPGSSAAPSTCISANAPPTRGKAPPPVVLIGPTGRC